MQRVAERKQTGLTLNEPSSRVIYVLQNGGGVLIEVTSSQC